MTEDEVICQGVLAGVEDHGTIVSLKIEGDDGECRTVHCDHRAGCRIWEDLQNQYVTVKEGDDGVKYVVADE